MTSIRIEGCTVDDGPAVARNNVPAFWTNAQWRLIWREKTLEHVTSQAALRMSWNLLRDPIHRRHQKAVDVNTGAVVGYARWILPDPYPDGAVDVRSVWADGKVDAPSEERVKEIDREMQSADWTWDHSLDVMDEPISAAQERLRKGKSYLSKCCYLSQPHSAFTRPLLSGSDYDIANLFSQACRADTSLTRLKSSTTSQSTRIRWARALQRSSLQPDSRKPTDSISMSSSTLWTLAYASTKGRASCCLRSLRLTIAGSGGRASMVRTFSRSEYRSGRVPVEHTENGYW